MEIAGRSVAAGEAVMVLLPAANRTAHVSFGRMELTGSKS
ncbi:hypothetical protein SAMN05421507_118125 [Lentzea jiangxiensis]|uniref:Uncharacterized protein n=1 Tax=Lentzea jiangxiensis TaxID=641025 RepID=A0A1H0WD53_9PSEU|nr:hypothetical protein SAMN05421507_118125 [Lentzea jiangxiensis]